MKDDINENKLVKKIKSALSSLSQEAISHVLILYYTLRAPDTPAWVRTVILGALGYFISLIDGIPDLTPILGYTDDISVLAAAIAALSSYITPEIREKAKEKTEQLFPSSRTPKNNQANERSSKDSDSEQD